MTVASAAGNRFAIALIPHSADATILGRKRVGDAVNIECDVIGKYVEKLLGGMPDAPRQRDISLDFLQQHGFA